MDSAANFATAEGTSASAEQSPRSGFRRWAVLLDLLLILVLIGYGAGIAVGDSDAENPMSGDLFLLAGFYWAPAALGLLLACDRTLTERLAPATRRRPSASALNPLSALGGCGRIPWVVWWVVVLVTRATVDDALFPPDGAFGSGGLLIRLALGAVLVAACLTVGVGLGRLIAALLGRAVSPSRPRTPHAVRLILLGAVVCGAALLAAAVMSVDSAVRTGSAGRHLFLDAVVGGPAHESYPTGPLWGARVGLAVLALALPPLPVLLRRRARAT